jgi:diguanylate cyclase
MEAASVRDAGLSNTAPPEIPSHGAGRRRARRTPVRAIPDRSEAAELRNSVPRDRAAAFFTYIGVVVVAGVASVGFSFTDLPEQFRVAPAGLCVIAALAIAVDSQSFTAPGRGPASTVFPSIAFTFALLLGWGLAPAVAVQAVAVVVSAIRLRHVPWRAAFNASQYALALAAAWLVLRSSGVSSLSSVGEVSTAAVAAIVGAACAWFAVNDLLVTTAVWLRFGGRWPHLIRRRLREYTMSTFALLALGPLVVGASVVSASLVPLVLIPLYSANQWARSSEEERRKSMYDDLTGLPNRRALFAEMIYQARSYAERSPRAPGDHRRMALLLLDIDQFKRVNDALGHTVGDRLLGAVAERVRECIGSDGFVARLGGDEFAVLAPRLVDPAAARVLAQRVADALAEPVTLDGLPLDVTASIGVAIHPDHGTDNANLLRHAEVAMYDAKDRASTFAVYTPESDHNSPERLQLVAELRRALEVSRPDEIQLYYQPQIDMLTGVVVGVEALLRWQHPKRGAVDPEHLIRVAEHTAVMRLLTSRVIEDAIGQLAKWRAQGLNLRVSINVSVRDLHRPELVDHLSSMLTDRGVSPNQVQLEITEGALMADTRRVLVTLHRLDRLGVALSLDDFGTGYSSLQHLRRLPLAEVKIDRSFVLGMTSDPDDAAVVGSIIDLARALGLRVVAEGVEEDSTRRMLINGGCEVAQGWLYARPMPADALISWLGRYRPAPSLDGRNEQR